MRDNSTEQVKQEEEVILCLHVSVGSVDIVMQLQNNIIDIVFE